MTADTSNAIFPEQHGPEKQGPADPNKLKEKYLRDSGKIEDFPEDDQAPVSNKTGKLSEGPSNKLTDKSGEEKDEEYINTDERQQDLEKRGL